MLLESRDFNGISFGKLQRHLNVTQGQLCETIEELVIDKVVGILIREWDNPHINRLGFPEIAIQVAALGTINIDHTCIYPRPPFLNQFVTDDYCRTEPYKRELAFGAPQLDFRSFDLMVLEHYRNDPRYIYHNSDVSGRICVSDDFFQSDSMAEADQVLLQSFGFSYDDQMNRAVAVFFEVSC